MKKSRNRGVRSGEIRTSTKRLAEYWEPLETRSMLSATPSGLTPAQVRAAYGFNSISFTTASGSVVGDGSGQTIAIVDAYVSSTIVSDLDVFDKAFGTSSTSSTLYGEYGAASSFLTLHNMATKSSKDSGWALETALDVEWAHAIAPGADIVLVEAASASLTDLLSAVTYAKSISGVSVVSMSWGTTEFSTETSFDSYFTTPSGHEGITFVASAGDTAGTTSWPAVSYNVLSVGGTTLSLNSEGSYKSETAWNSSGGGRSAYESEGTYQSSVDTSGKRWSPDVAYDAATSSGFSVYTATSQGGQTGWFTVGGTSAGAPQWAALVAIADQGRVISGLSTLDGATQTLPTLYGLSSSDFHDVTSGTSGKLAASTGYDVVTGLGSPIANLVVGGLVGSTTTTSGGTTSGSSGTGSGGSSGRSTGPGTGGGRVPSRSPYGGMPRGVGRFPMSRARSHFSLGEDVMQNESAATVVDVMSLGGTASLARVFSQIELQEGVVGLTIQATATGSLVAESAVASRPVMGGDTVTVRHSQDQHEANVNNTLSGVRLGVAKSWDERAEMIHLPTLTEGGMEFVGRDDEDGKASGAMGSGWRWLVAGVLAITLFGKSKKNWREEAEESSS